MRVSSLTTSLAMIGVAALLTSGCGGGSSGASAGASPSSSGFKFLTTTPSPSSSPPPISSPLTPLLLSAADVTRLGGDSVREQPYQEATTVTGQATLDLCNKTYPSEAQRQRRLQVGYIDATNREAASEEVVYYRPGGTQAAFSQVKAAAASCPKTVHEGKGATETHLVVRPRSASLATDQLTVTQHLHARGQSIWAAAVYQYAGRLFIGIYTARPTAAEAVHVARALAVAVAPRLQAAATASA